MNKIDGLNFGETIYCIEQDIEEYIQNNNLEEDENLNLILKEIENLPKFKEVYNKQLQQLKVENEQLKEKIKTYEKMFNNEEFRVALTDVRTGERELWQKYKPRMIKYKQCLDEIEKKIKGLCKRCTLDFKVEDVNSIPNKEYCDDAICYSILQLIKQAKEGEE